MASKQSNKTLNTSINTMLKTTSKKSTKEKVAEKSTKDFTKKLNKQRYYDFLIIFHLFSLKIRYTPNISFKFSCFILYIKIGHIFMLIIRHIYCPLFIKLLFEHQQYFKKLVHSSYLMSSTFLPA